MKCPNNCPFLDPGEYSASAEYCYPEECTSSIGCVMEQGGALYYTTIKEFISSLLQATEAELLEVNEIVIRQAGTPSDICPQCGGNIPLEERGGCIICSHDDSITGPRYPDYAKTGYIPF